MRILVNFLIICAAKFGLSILHRKQLTDLMNELVRDEFYARHGLNSASSKYKKMLRQVIRSDNSFTKEENSGYHIFEVVNDYEFKILREGVRENKRLSAAFAAKNVENSKSRPLIVLNPKKSPTAKTTRKLGRSIVGK